jgi:predicted membrane channel-forming protein YqfA (hemolysin III family)
VSQLLTLGISWFVYDSWWALTLNMVAAIITAQVATMDIWALPADYRRHRGGQVAFVGCIAACYWWPMGVQAAQDLWAWRGAAGLGPLAAGAAGLPSLAASVYTVGALVALAFGAATFALGVPERLLPGVFDTVGFSHQWMHVGASAAHVFEYLFVLEMWRRRTAAHAGA